MVWSFVHLAVRSLFALLLLFGRADRSKDLEILVLRHELAVLRRRSGRPPIERADRALLAILSRGLPRRAWATFSVRPETVLRWHRQLVSRRWTYPRVKPGRPPLDRPRRELSLRFARENPVGCQNWRPTCKSLISLGAHRILAPHRPRPENRCYSLTLSRCPHRRSRRSSSSPCWPIDRSRCR